MQQSLDDDFGLLNIEPEEPEESEESENLALKTGLTFTNWQEFNIWIDNFAKKKGLTTRLGLVKWMEK